MLTWQSHGDFTLLERCQHVPLTYHLHNVRYRQPLTPSRGVRATYSHLAQPWVWRASSLLLPRPRVQKKAANMTSKHVRTKKTHGWSWPRSQPALLAVYLQKTWAQFKDRYVVGTASVRIWVNTDTPQHVYWIFSCSTNFYYITFNYMPCNIPPALLNNRLAIWISGPISNISVGPGPKVLFLYWPCFSAIWLADILCRHFILLLACKVSCKYWHNIFKWNIL